MEAKRRHLPQVAPGEQLETVTMQPTTVHGLEESPCM